MEVSEEELDPVVRKMQQELEGKSDSEESDTEGL